MTETSLVVLGRWTRPGPRPGSGAGLPRADQPLPAPHAVRGRGGDAGWHARAVLASLGLHALGLGLLGLLAGGSPTPVRPARVAMATLCPQAAVEPEIAPLEEDLLPLEEMVPPLRLDATPEAPPPSPETLDTLPEPDPDERVFHPVPLASLELSLASIHLSLPRRVEPEPTPPPAPAPRAQPPHPSPPPPVERARPVRAPAAPLRILRAPDPRLYYPARALADRASGLVQVELTIAASGLVIDATVVGSSGRGDLDEAAISLARAYRFSAGDDVRWARLPVTFRPPG